MLGVLRIGLLLRVLSLHVYRAQSLVDIDNPLSGVARCRCRTTSVHNMPKSMQPMMGSSAAAALHL
jgi:hypothetical protein